MPEFLVRTHIAKLRGGDGIDEVCEYGPGEAFGGGEGWAGEVGTGTGGIPDCEGGPVGGFDDGSAGGEFAGCAEGVAGVDVLGG